MMAFLSLAGLLAVSAGAEGKFTERQLQAVYPYDLGPEEVDVAGYPKAQKDNYGIFARTCSQCHTLARPINSPLSSRKDWKRYIDRMHLRAKTVAGAAFLKEDAAAIVDFLVYDSEVRKVKGKEAFESKAAELKGLFAAVKKERARRKTAEDEKKVKPRRLYEGVKPQ